MATGKLSFFRLPWFLKGGKGKQVLLRPNKGTKAKKQNKTKQTVDVVKEYRTLEQEGSPTFPVYQPENQIPER